MIAGRNDSAVLNFFNRDLSDYSGKGPEFYGAYGQRLRQQHGMDQLELAFHALKANATSRQVVLQIWDAETDLPNQNGQPRNADIPCNTQSMLRIQGGKLHWLQTMRSNDLFRGLPYNLVQFTTLQEVVAGWLGLELGTYTHVVNSLHFYHSDKEKLEAFGEQVPIGNDQSLTLSWDESKKVWQFLSELITQASLGGGEAMTMARDLDSKRIPNAHENVANVILAEAARRHGDVDFAFSCLNKVTNAALRQIANASFARSRPPRRV